MPGKNLLGRCGGDVTGGICVDDFPLPCPDPDAMAIPDWAYANGFQNLNLNIPTLQLTVDIDAHWVLGSTPDRQYYDLTKVFNFDFVRANQVDPLISNPEIFLLKACSCCHQRDPGIAGEGKEITEPTGGTVSYENPIFTSGGNWLVNPLYLVDFPKLWRDPCTGEIKFYLSGWAGETTGANWSHNETLIIPDLSALPGSTIEIQRDYAAPNTATLKISATFG